MQHAETGQPDLKKIELQAGKLAETMPELLIEAQRVAHNVVHGVHGRRRAGPGETFWQFRQYQNSDSVYQIDWRRSASSDALYIREREWEAAHTMWLWPDMSQSMQFQSHLSHAKKGDRALVLAFALCELLVKAGERVGILGLSTPMTNYNTAQRLAEILVQAYRQGQAPAKLPPKTAKVSALSECVILSDCLEPVETFMEHCRALASRGVRGHVVHILDPIEETFPYQGRVEFQNIDGGQKVLFQRAQSVRDAYQDRLAQHKAELRQSLDALQWTYRLHHTDRPAGELLLGLHGQISGSEKHMMSSQMPLALGGAS